MPTLDSRSQVLSIKDRRNGREKTSVQTCSRWKRTGVYSVFLMKCYNGSSFKPASWLSTVWPMCDGRPFASPPFVNRTPHTSHFLVFARMFNSVARDIGSMFSAHHPIHVSCACVSDLSSTLHFALFTVSPIFFFIFLIFHFLFHVDVLGSSVHFVRPVRSLAVWPITPLSQVTSPTSSTITTAQRPLKFSPRSHPA